jgi:nucleoside-diphosphate-sugar epimerase
MTVLVTGASGFLGSHLTDLLLERGERPRILVAPGERVTAWTDADVEIHHGDVCDRATLEAAVDGVGRVLHCAARTGPWGPRIAYQRTNVDALGTLVDVAMAAGVERIVHVSSITVHGNDVRGSADERGTLRAGSNPYSWSKLAGERLLARMVRDAGAPVTIVRPGWIYGPRDTASFGRFAEMIGGGRMVVIGSGHNHVPLVYVEDVARGIVLAAECDAAAGRSYLLVNDERITQLDLLNGIAAQLGVPAPSRRIPYRLGVTLGALAEAGGLLARRAQPPPVMRYGVQLLGGENRFVIDRARRELGFSPQVSLAEGIHRSVEWYRARSEPARRPKERA